MGDVTLEIRRSGVGRAFAEFPVERLDHQSKSSAAEYETDKGGEEKRDDKATRQRNQRTGYERRESTTDIPAEVLDRNAG